MMMAMISLRLARFEVFMVMKIPVVVFWVLTPSNDVLGYQHFSVGTK
jgi:uncharacterized membrane protein YpjA